MFKQRFANGASSEPAPQSRLVHSRATTFTARRIDSIVGRFYSVALGLATLEVTINALEQQHLLNPTGFWLLYGFYLASNLAIIVSNWFFEAHPAWYLLNALVILGAVFAWPLVVPNPHLLPVGFTPFVWWMAGWGGISAGLALNKYLAPVYILALPTAFALLQVSPSGGSASDSVAIQNGVYTVLISSVVTGVIWFLRWQARQQDLAAEVASSSAAQAAAEQAIADERFRVASVVHNQVLGALNAAVNAYSDAQVRTAAHLAEVAIQRLGNLEKEEADQDQFMSAAALFSSLSSLVSDQSSSVVVSSRAEGDLQVPVAVAHALTEATQQAVANSLMHAGTGEVSRRVSMKATEDTLKISIVDDGKGFWLARVPKNRLGIRLIILRGVTEAGGESLVSSKPKEGTSVVLEWAPNDN